MAHRQRTLIELVEAALDLPEDEQAAHVTAHAADPQMAADALTMLGHAAGSAHALRTGLPGALHALEADIEPPERIGAYRVLAPIGRGGMGVVWLGARDADDFERQVAIKIIRPGLLSPDLIERFNRERQILARLDHPHIARLYDGGQTSEGAPFLVMEFVPGQPLDQWAEGAGLPARLAHFRQVLGAVATAHRNLVIHRDLTPGNILVTAEAGVKLIDFGIARPPDDPGAEPAPDARAATATPGYAAPEAGQGATTLSDIYALGRLLADLAGAEPELAAIAAKASAHDPAARYPTVEALDAEIAAFQTGLPVAAFSTARIYRARKFVRRQRIGVALAAAAAAVLLAGVLALTSAYRAERAAREAADARFGEVRELANFMLFDLYDRLEPVPGNTAALNAIADTSRSYLGRLSQINGAPRAVRLETALAHKRLSDVLGGAREAGLGRREEAYAMLQAGIAELQALHRENPADHAVTEALADALRARTAIEYVGLDDNDAAALSATMAANLYRELAAAGWKRRAMRLAEIGARTEHSVTHGWEAGKEAIGVREFAGIETALTRIEREYGIAADTLAARANLETHYAATLGKAIFAAGSDDYEPAVAMGAHAIATYDRLLAITDDPAGQQRGAITALYEQAILLSGLDRDRESLPLLERAEGFARELLRRDPDDQGINRRLTSVMGQYTIALAYSGEGPAAWAKGREVIARKEALLALEPGNGARQRELVDTLVLVGEAHQTTGDAATACLHFRRAHGMAEDFRRRTGQPFNDVWGQIGELPERIRMAC